MMDRMDRVDGILRLYCVYTVSIVVPLPPPLIRVPIVEQPNPENNRHSIRRSKNSRSSSWGDKITPRTMVALVVSWARQSAQSVIARLMLQLFLSSRVLSGPSFLQIPRPGKHQPSSSRNYLSSAGWAHATSVLGGIKVFAPPRAAAALLVHCVSSGSIMRVFLPFLPLVLTPSGSPTNSTSQSRTAFAFFTWGSVGFLRLLTV